MPYASKAQQRFFHAASARGDIKPSTVHEFDEATNFKKLPERVHRSFGGAVKGIKMSRGGRMFGGGIATGYEGRADEAAMREGEDYPSEEFFGGGVATGYEGEADEADYRGADESESEHFAHGGECPNCGYALGGPVEDEGGPGMRVAAKGPIGGEEGPDNYATHGMADPHSPRESFGRALRKRFGRHGM